MRLPVKAQAKEHGQMNPQGAKQTIGGSDPIT
jgi:hypothetical protein